VAKDLVGLEVALQFLNLRRRAGVGAEFLNDDMDQGEGQFGLRVLGLDDGLGQSAQLLDRLLTSDLPARQRRAFDGRRREQLFGPVQGRAARTVLLLAMVEARRVA